MDDLFEEPEATDEPTLRRERTPSDDELEQTARQRRLRWILGASCLVIGLGAVALALATRGDDDAPAKQTATAGATTTTAGSGAKTSVESATTVPGAKPTWPAGATGRPAAFGALEDPPPAEAGDLPDGFYLWTDFDGWHLWLVGGTETDKVTITSDDTITKAEPVGGPVDVQEFGNVVAMRRGSATERVVGIDFNPGYYSKNMIVAVEGGQRVRLGAGANVVPTYFALRFE